MLPSAGSRLLALLVVTALAACGGGGGGGGGGEGGGGGGAGGGGAPNPPTFGLSDANALTASAAALHVIEHPGLVAELPLIAALELDERGVPEFNIACGTGFVELRHVDADHSGTISVTDSLSATHTAPCAGIAAGRVTLQLSEVDLPSLRIAGTAQLAIESVAGHTMAGTFSLTTNLAFDELAFILTNISLTSTRGGNTDRLSAGRFDRRFDVDSNYAFSFSGQLDSELAGGRFSFSTPVPFTGTFGELPDDGVLVSAAGQTQVRLAVSPLPEERQLLVRYQLDTGGGYGAPSTVRWREVTSGLLFLWIPNDPPVISSLEVLPFGAKTGDVVTAHVTATDVDGDALTSRFSWAFRQAVFPDFGPVFSLAGLSKGETVSVTVTVSDGRFEATETTSFTVANAPPVIASLVFDPPDPRSIDDLAVAAVLEDADADALTVEYEWSKNGVVIPGVTGTMLPHSTFSKDDVITVAVGVGDGTATASDEASVTIGDTPAQLAWLAPPTAVAHGTPFGVRAVATDPDGDALPPDLRFELRYGPAGMTVDPSTGDVSWLAGGPMFDRSMTVRFGVGTNVAGGGSVDGEVVVEDSVREYPLARSSIDPGMPYTGLRAGDFDGDGDSEMLVLTDGGVLYELEASGDSYRQSWMYPFALEPRPRALATADVDGDGVHELFVATANVLLKLDGAERRVAGSVTLPLPGASWTCGDLEAGDVDNDGVIEIVCSGSPNPMEAGNNQPLVVVDAATMTVEGSTGPGAFGNDFALGNVDGDPALEIVTWRGFVFDGVTLAQQWAHEPGFGLGVAVGDVTGDGVAEIVAAYANESGTVGRVFSAVSQSSLFELPHLGFTTNVVADIDGAAPAEILMAGSRLAAYRYDEDTGTVATLFALVLPDFRGATTLAVANVDRAQDAQLELVMGTNADTIDVADWPDTGVRIEWSSADLEPEIPQTISGPFFGGQLTRSPAHAPQPLFMAPTTGLKPSRLFTLDAASGELAFSPQIPDAVSFSFDVGDLAVTDFDGDGTDEVFMTVVDELVPGVGVYDFFGGALEFRSEPLPGSAAVDVDHGNFNGDGPEELVALTADGWLIVYDVFAGAVLWSELVQGNAKAVAVADLDGSGPPEIIAAMHTDAFVFSLDSASSSFVRRYEWRTHFQMPDLAAGDVDGDGEVEIFVLTNDVRGFGVQRFNARLEPTAWLALDWQPTSLSIEGSAFGRKNLIGTEEAGPGAHLRAFDPLLGEEIWRSPAIHGLFAPNSVHFVDIAGDGVLRIAFGTYHGAFLTR